MKEIKIVCFNNGTAQLTTGDTHFDNENLATRLEIDFSKTDYSDKPKWVDIIVNKTIGYRYELGTDEIVSMLLTSSVLVNGEMVITPIVYDGELKVKYRPNYTVGIIDQQEAIDVEPGENSDFIFQLKARMDELENTAIKDFDDLETHPTTLEGYGITDVYDKTEIGVALDLKADNTTVSDLDLATEKLVNKKTTLAESSDVDYPTVKAVKDGLDLKVDKVEGKSLVSDTEITHLEALDTQAELDIKFGAKEDIANKGVANGYAPLNASGIVDPIYVPGAYTDYVEYATYANLPASGVEGTLYVVIADETSGGNTSTYRWTGSIYVNVTDKLSASEVKALYESNANTNAYTDDQKTKLSGIEPNAEVNTLEAIKVEGELDLVITDKKSTIPLATDTISGALDKVDKAYIDNVRNGTQSIPYDNTTSGLDSTTLNGAIDEVEARVENVETEVKDNTEKNSEQDLRIATIEEAYRKSQSGELTATKSGTDIISLGKDVAPAPLQVKVDGGLIPALTNLISNGDFSNGTTGWAETATSSFTVSGGIGQFIASERFGEIRRTLTTPPIAIYYIRVDVKSTSNVVRLNVRKQATVTGQIDVLHSGNGNFETLKTAFSLDASVDFYARVIDFRTSGFDTVFVDNIHIFNLTASHGVTATSGTAYDNAVADIEAMLALNGGYISSTPIHAVSMNKRVRSVGKNLFDKGNSNILLNTTLSNAIDGVTGAFANRWTHTIRLQSSSTYKTNINLYRYVYLDSTLNVISGSNVQTTDIVMPTTAIYIKFTVEDNSTIPTFQLEQGTVATTYVPYANTDLYLQANKVGYKLLNGVADKIRYDNGAYVFDRYVGEYTLEASDITAISAQTNVDLVRISYTNISDYINKQTTDFSGVNLRTTRTVPNNGVSFVDDVSSEWKHYNGSALMTFIVPKNEYATLAEAQTDLAGTVIYYQLATLIETEILALGNAQGLAGGTVYIDDVMADSNIYTSKYDIENVNYPIKSLDRVVKINADGSQTELAVSSATIAGDGLSFTHPSLVANDIVWVAYVPNVANTFKSNTFVTYYDNPFIAVQPDGTPRRITFSVDNSGVVTVSSEAV